MRKLIAFGIMAGLAVAGTAGAADRKVTIGVVAKSQSNPVFQAAHQGALDAAAELGPKYGVTVVIDIQTPPQEDAQKQAAAVELLGRKGVDGIAVSCSDANTLTPAIDKAINAGAVVMCFDSDAPRSKRLCYYGTDDETCGKLVVQELAAIMGGSGKIAILSGSQAAPNLRNRVKGAKDEAAKHPGLTVIDTFYCQETPEQAAATVQREQAAHPDIQGWAMIGGWPLFTRDALKWAPGEIKVVSVDALPPQLAYVDSGHVEVLLAQDCYGWGYKSVTLLLDKIVQGKAPADARIIDPLTRVSKANVAEFGGMWDKWLGKKPSP